MAAVHQGQRRGKNAILTDNAQTFGVILLTGRPEQFFDRIDKGDARWNDALTDPDGEVQYMLLNRNAASGDLITEPLPERRQGDRGAA